jgi:hypothetical protein
MATFFMRILGLLGRFGARTVLTGRVVVIGFLRGLSQIIPKLVNRKVKLWGVEYSASELFMAIFWYVMESSSPGELGKKDAEIESSGRNSFNKIFGKRQSKLRGLLKGIRGFFVMIRTWFRTNSVKPQASRQSLNLPAIGRSKGVTLVSKGDSIVVNRGNDRTELASKAAGFIGTTILLDYLIDLLLSVDDITEFWNEFVRLYSEYWDGDELDVSDDKAKTNQAQDGQDVLSKVSADNTRKVDERPLTFDLLRAMLHGDTLTPGEYVRYDLSKASELIESRNLGMHMDEVISTLRLDSQVARQLVRSLSVLIISDLNDIYENYHSLRRKPTDNGDDKVSAYLMENRDFEELTDEEAEELLSEFDPFDDGLSASELKRTAELEGVALDSTRVTTFI